MSELKDKEEQYDIFLKNGENADGDEIGHTKAFKIVFFLFLTVAICSSAYYFLRNYIDIPTFINNIGKQNNEKTVKSKSDLTPSKFNFNMLNRYQNILVLGVDSNGPNTMPFSGVRSDTIIVLSVDLKGKSVNAISIPRDSKVYLADEHGVQKINSAYAFGGIDLTKKTIEETFGIKIHNYLIINAEGVRKLIDAIDGVPIHVDQNMKYHDFSGKLHIDFKKGDYVLDGKQAEEYLRFRKDMFGDIGRVHRQQKFIKAFIEKIKSPETLKNIPELIKIAGLYSRTDLNLYQMSQYASIARETDMNKVEFVMLPGAPNKRGIISYWILDPKKTQQVINRLIYRMKDETEDSMMSVGIMYSKSKEPEAFILKDTLKSEGYEVNCTGRSLHITKSEIIGYNTQVSNDQIKELKKTLPEISEFEYTHSPIRNFCDTSDVVITLSEPQNENMI